MRWHNHTGNTTERDDGGDKSGSVANFLTIRNIATWLLAAGAIALLVRAASGVVRRLTRENRLDFFHFYEAAIAVVEGTDIYESGSGGYIYPPLLAVLFSPFALMRYDFAVLAWLAVNLILILLVLFAGWKALTERFDDHSDRHSMICVISLATIFSSEQIRWQLILGQTDTITLAGATLALIWLDRRPLLAGAILGGVANIKYQALLLLPYLFLRKRLAAAASLIAGVVGMALFPALFFGWEKNLAYLGIAFGGMLEMVGIDVGRAAAVPDLTWDRSITLTSGLARMLESGGLDPDLAILAAVFVGGAVLIVVWKQYQLQQIPLLTGRGGKQERWLPWRAVTAVEWCGLLIAISIFSPQGTKRHLFLLLLVNLTITFMLWNARIPSTRCILIAGIVISQLAIRLPPNQLYEEAAAAWNFVGGPSWGILILCFAFVQAGLQEARAAANQAPAGLKD